MSQRLKKITHCLMILTAMSVMCGCVHVNTVSLSSIPADRNQVVKATGSRTLLFGISFSSDFIDETKQKLSQQCQDGKIEGILTKLETTNYFLGLIMVQDLTAKGFCL